MKRKSAVKSLGRHRCQKKSDKIYSSRAQLRPSPEQIRPPKATAPGGGWDHKTGPSAGPPRPSSPLGEATEKCPDLRLLSMHNDGIGSPSASGPSPRPHSGGAIAHLPYPNRQSIATVRVHLKMAFCCHCAHQVNRCPSHGNAYSCDVCNRWVIASWPTCNMP